jgi:tetratricopeptide (TPR) repeat protein
VSVELDDSYQSIYQRAISQMALGNSDQAIASLWRILNRLTRLRPQTLQRKEDLQQTLRVSWESLVQFLRWERRYDEAISACEKVLDHLPEDEGAEQRIGSLMVERGDVEEGIARMRQIVDDKPSFGAWADLGSEYAAQGQHEEAASCYRSALALADSNEAAAIGNLGLVRVYQEADRIEEALEAWSMAVVLNPDIGANVSAIYAWLIERGDLERAETYLNREQDPLHRTFYQGLLDWQAGRHDAAQEAWRRVLGMELTEDVSLGPWIEAALRLGEPQRAAEAEEMLSARETSISVREGILLGIAHAMLDEVDEAKTWFEGTIGRLRRGWPVKEAIEKAHWTLLTSVVSNQETIQALAGYFDRG